MSEAKQALILDATLLGLSASCGEKYNLKQNLLIHPRKTAEPLERGDLTHTFFEEYYNNIKKGLDFDSNIERCVIKCRNKYTEYETVEIEQCEYIIACCVENANFYRFDRWEPLEVEVPFLKSVHEDDKYVYALSGKIDLIANTQTLKRVPIDHKSYERWFEPQRRDFQFLIYSIVMWSMNLIVNRIGLQKTVAANEKHRRVILNYSESLLKNELETIIWWMKNHAWMVENNTYPRNNTSCDKYGGCEYRKVCDAESEQDMQFVIDSQYKRGEPWDVTAVLKEGKQILRLQEV